MRRMDAQRIPFETFSAKQLKQFLSSQGISTKDCIEKKDFVLKAQAHPQSNIDLSAVRNDIAHLLHDQTHDDGSYAPLLIRFAWHNSGTYDKTSNTGGVRKNLPLLLSALRSRLVEIQK